MRAACDALAMRIEYSWYERRIVFELNSAVVLVRAPYDPMLAQVQQILLNTAVCRFFTDLLYII